MKTLADTQFELKLLGYKGITIRRGEVAALHKVLFEDERIIQAVFGSYDNGFGLIAATDRRILFVAKKFFRTCTIDMPYESVRTVECDTTLFTGTLTLYAGVDTLQLRGVKKSRAVDFFNYLNGQVGARPQPTVLRSAGQGAV